MKKILFTDIDGTLLDSNRKITKENQQAIDAALAKGHAIVIATGRPLNSGKMVVEQLGLMKAGCYMIAYNGAVIYDCGANKVLGNQTLPMEYVEYLFAEAKKQNLHIQTYHKDVVVSTKMSDELAYYQNHTGLPYQVVSSLREELTEEPQKVMLIHREDKEVLQKFQASHATWAEGKCNSFFSNDYYLEYCPINASKAYGISYLCDYLQVPHEHTIAVGDERNDISMIEAAAVGVAMRNAKDEVKAIADYITKNDNNHSGVAEVIERYLLKGETL